MLASCDFQGALPFSFYLLKLWEVRSFRAKLLLTRSLISSSAYINEYLIYSFSTLQNISELN